MPRKRLFRLRWDVQAMLLLTAVVAVWVPYFHLRQKIARNEQQIDSMRNLARELIVDDPGKIAVVKKQETWSNESRWEIHLPDGEYVMRLATREIDENGFAPAAGETRILGGRHLIELRKSYDADCREITVILDDKLAIETTESKDWDQGRHSTETSRFGNCVQVPPDEPVVFSRLRFDDAVKPGQTTTPQGPTEGLLLWIERVPEEAGKVDSQTKSGADLRCPPGAAAGLSSSVVGGRLRAWAKRRAENEFGMTTSGAVSMSWPPRSASKNA